MLITKSRSLLKLISTKSMMLSNHLIFCRPLLLLPSIFPSIRVFWVSSSHQVAKVLELQLQHLSFQRIFRTDFLYDWLVWSLCSPRDSQESSPTPPFKSINSLVLSFLYGLTLTSIHDQWKSHSFDYMDLCYFSHIPAHFKQWSLICPQKIKKNRYIAHNTAQREDFICHCLSWTFISEGIMHLPLSTFSLYPHIKMTYPWPKKLGLLGHFLLL